MRGFFCLYLYMRILYSAKYYLPDYRAGDSVNAHTIHKFLISRGHEVVVMRGRMQMPYEIDGIQVVARDNTWYEWADVVTTALDFTQVTIEDVSTLRPIIFYMHNTFYETTLNRNPHVSIVYNNPYVERESNYANDGITITPPVEPSDYQVDNTGAEYITLINCNRGKGVEMFAKIAAALPDKKFLAVLGGYGIQSPPIASNVTICDIQSDIRNVYKVTRLLLMPSLYESWGRTASEAACSGIPVICNDTWGLRENLGDDGIFCSNFESWIEAINKMDEKKEYDKASAAIKKRAVSPVKKLEELEKFMQKKINEHNKKKQYV